jgi:predicted dehydrogenase
MMGQEHISNIALLEGVEVGALVEPDAQMRALAQAAAPGATAHASLAEMLAVEAGNLDALVIASPNDLHLAHFAEIAATAPLPLLIEKPVYTEASGAAALRDLAARYPAPVWVAMEYRYMPPISALIAAAEAATGGIRMLTIREHRFPFLEKVGGWNRFDARTGGTLVEKCCHFFDLMRLILADEPVRVMATGGQAVNHLDETVLGQRPDVWDHAYVIVEFSRGARAMLELCMFAEGGRWQEELCVTGPSGKAECFVPGPGRFWPADLPAPVAELVISPRHPKGPAGREIPVPPELLAAGDHNGATFYQHLRFAEVVRGGGAVEVTVEDGARAVEMGLAAQRSAETGQAVGL